MQILIQVKFKANFSGLKANICTNCSANLINVHRIKSRFMRNSKWNSCYAYRVNRLLKQDENQHVARLSIRGVSFDG